MEAQDLDIKEKAKHQYDYVMRFIKENYKYNEIKQFLMDDGMNEVTAKAVITEVLLLEKKKAKDEMKFGAIIALAGVVIAVLGYLLPFDEVNPSRHVIIYGPIVFGGIMFFRGLSKSK